MKNKKCPLCDLDLAEAKDHEEPRLKVIVSCRNCGQYILHADILRLLENNFQNIRFLLSGFIREHTEDHLPTLEVSQFMLDNLSSYVAIPSGLFEMMDKILMHIYKKSSYSGEPIELMDFEFAIA